MNLVHQHKKYVERKTKWHSNFLKFKPQKRKEYKLKPTSKQRKPIPIQSSQRKKKTKNRSKILRGPRF
jgi:hypothetical protein